MENKEEREIHPKSVGEWYTGHNTSPLADTGDYMSEAFITNGEVQLFCYDENFVEEDGLESICDRLNDAQQKQAEFIKLIEGEIAGYQSELDNDLLSDNGRANNNIRIELLTDLLTKYQAL